MITRGEEKKEIPDGPQMLRRTVLACGVCVPADMGDEAIVAFAEREYPCGTSSGWFLAQDGDDILRDTPAVVPCEERQGYVHRVLYC